MLTIHSPFRIENHTSASLEFEVHLFSAPHLRGGPPPPPSPSAGPLMPNLQCYLPTPAIWYRPVLCVTCIEDLLTVTSGRNVGAAQFRSVRGLEVHGVMLHQM